MKMRFFVITILCLSYNLLNAQTQPDSAKIFKDHSVQFRVYDFISLSQFKGALLSYKYHTSDESAFRFGISLRVQKWKIEELQERFYIDTAYLDLDTDNNDVQFIITIEYMKYFNPEDEVKLFMGIGPRLLIDMNNYDVNDIAGFGFPYNKKYKNDRYEIGIVFNYGLEWFFRKNMSLHAEYGFHVSYFNSENVTEQYRPSSDETIRIDTRDRKESGVILDDSGALLGLSVYF